MQAVEIRRMRVNRVIVAAAVVGTVVAGALGLAAWDAIDDRFGPTAPRGSASQSVDYKFIEENTQLPGDVGERSLSKSQIEFLEENEWLPVTGADVALLAPEHRAKTGEINF